VWDLIHDKFVDPGAVDEMKCLPPSLEGRRYFDSPKSS